MFPAVVGQTQRIGKNLDGKYLGKIGHAVEFAPRKERVDQDFGFALKYIAKLFENSG